MKILWIAKKKIDRALDSVTWLEMVENIRRLGHEIVFATAYDRKPGDADLYRNIVSLCGSRFGGLFPLVFSASASWFLFRTIIRWRPGVIVVDPWLCIPLLIGVLVRSLTNIRVKFVMDIRTIPVEVSGIKGKFQQMIFDLGVRFGARIADGVTVITPYMAQHLITVYGMRKGKIIGHWTSGVRTDVFDPKRLIVSEMIAAREHFGLKDKFVVMYHGIITGNRGLLETVRSIGMLDDYPDIVFVVIGDGPYMTKLQNTVRDLGLEDRVRILGRVPHLKIPYYIGLADVGILPFPDLIWWRVSSPIKMFEYLAMEKPIIASKIVAHRQLLGACRCVFYVESIKPSDIARTLLDVYMRKDTDLKEAGRVGRRIALNFTWSRQARSFIRSLEGILENETQR